MTGAMGRITGDPATWEDGPLARGFLRWFNDEARMRLFHDEQYVLKRDQQYLAAVNARRGDEPLIAWVERATASAPLRSEQRSTAPSGDADASAPLEQKQK